MYENNMETPYEGAANCCTDTHLGQQTRDGNTSHTLVCENIRKRSTVEAVVPRFAENHLTPYYMTHTCSTTVSGATVR
jgi:hypothetical protein